MKKTLENEQRIGYSDLNKQIACFGLASDIRWASTIIQKIDGFFMLTSPLALFGQVGGKVERLTGPNAGRQPFNLPIFRFGDENGSKSFTLGGMTMSTPATNPPAAPNQKQITINGTTIKSRFSLAAYIFAQFSIFKGVAA